MIAMVNELTNTVFDCATCAEPKARHPRTGEWGHLRSTSLCDDANLPVAVRLPIPARV